MLGENNDLCPKCANEFLNFMNMIPTTGRKENPDGN
jgi:hypothetical protein